MVVESSTGVTFIGKRPPQPIHPEEVNRIVVLPSDATAQLKLDTRRGAVFVPHAAPEEDLIATLALARALSDILRVPVVKFSVSDSEYKKPEGEEGPSRRPPADPE